MDREREKKGRKERGKEGKRLLNTTELHTNFVKQGQRSRAKA